MVSFLVPLERPLENFVSETSPRNNKSDTRSYLIPPRKALVLCVCRHHRQNHRRKEKKGREDDDEKDGLK